MIDIIERGDTILQFHILKQMIAIRRNLNWFLILGPNATIS